MGRVPPADPRVRYAPCPVNSSTGYTPNRLMLGRGDLLYPVPDPTPGVEVHDSTWANLQEETTKAHEVARATLRSTQMRLKRKYDLRSYSRRFQEGDLVYILDTAHTKGKCKKNEFPVEWTGSSGGEEAVRLKAVISVVNHDRMKACHARKVPAWCKRKLLGGPEQVYCLCRKKDDGKLMVQCNEYARMAISLG